MECKTNTFDENKMTLIYSCRNEWHQQNAWVFGHEQTYMGFFAIHHVLII